jgi:precorrin-6B methylase 2
MIGRIRRELGIVLAGILLASSGTRLVAQTPSARQEETRREAWQKISEIFDAMGVRPGAVVADVGAGDGFLTVRLASAVAPGGRVFAVDISEGALDRLRTRVQQEGLANVTITKGDSDDPHLSTASLDGAVIINAYHEMVDHQSMLEHLRMALKPAGRLVMVEPISEKMLNASRKQQTNVHEIAAWFAEQEVREAGFRVQMLRDPFTSRSDVNEWLIVAVPEPNTAAADFAFSSKDDSALANRNLRIGFDEFKRRRTESSIVVVDVRSEEEYLAGHIPGATWVQLSDLNSHLEQLRSLHKPIVTYCS